MDNLASYKVSGKAPNAALYFGRYWRDPADPQSAKRYAKDGRRDAERMLVYDPVCLQCPYFAIDRIGPRSMPAVHRAAPKQSL
jgi:hypothetical protein